MRKNLSLKLFFFLSFFLLFFFSVSQASAAAECVGCNADSNYVGRNDYNGYMPPDSECQKNLCNPCGGGTCWTHDNMGGAGCECQQSGNKAWCESKGVCCNGGTRVACAGQTLPGTGSGVCGQDGKACKNDYDCTHMSQSPDSPEIPDCQNYYCTAPAPIFGINEPGVCKKNFDPPDCKPEYLTMKVEPPSPKVGQEVTLSLSGPQGSTYVHDIFTPSSNITCPAFNESGNGGFWPSTKCTVIAEGGIHWMHQWRNTAPNQIDIAGPTCSKGVDIGVKPSGPAPTSGAPCNKDGVVGRCDTAIGVFDVSDPRQFIAQLFSWVLAIGGISAFILLIYSGYLLMVSGGDKQKLQDARERIVAAITGLLFIILSISIFEFIGVDVLKLPGFGR